MQYAIVTGDSRGLGEAIAEQFLGKSIHVIGVSRHSNKELSKLAEKYDGNYTHVGCDLSDPSQLEKGIEQVVKQVTHNDTHFIYLVNNAGVIEPIETVGNFHLQDVSKHMMINVTAPMMFVNHLLKEANDHSITTAIINITSGAAERSVHGWSVYSSSKAAINRFTETTALEQEMADKEHKIIAYSPGVVDTDMQKEIRSSKESAFADLDKFKALKEEGQLNSPKTVAAVLMDLLNDYSSIESGKVYKLYDLIESKA
ncbi:(S)-benzoin forming benzil reductase [Halobacillus shinanisalinarum]|uniref:(S)-benzoin forming benzil reductase n=1 Tax=Halobacillus shinanisalinarum TaxID=2932258 RepID=A0ABY4GXE1_9BACI|nr:(S)-benzoin forming benzil reductase [Halobacillus shinanisalinarum]UOQ92686.1 (S)-benzoin forming benzil reductase [Halobacillus shinanisalinarum]